VSPELSNQRDSNNGIHRQFPSCVHNIRELLLYINVLFYCDCLRKTVKISQNKRYGWAHSSSRVKKWGDAVYGHIVGEITAVN
jgi:hypothetical protein